MKLTITNTKNKLVLIKDAMGKTMSTAFSYDTKTGKTGLYLLSAQGTVLMARKNGESYAVKIFVTIPGSYALLNGKKVK